MINASKTEFIIFQKPSIKQNTILLTVDNVQIQESTTVKYLGVTLDKHLTYQSEVKQILKKMATGIKTIYVIRNFITENTRILLLHALVLSHLQYSAILLTGITSELLCTLQKQINWGIKAACFKKKSTNIDDIKNRFKILHLDNLIDLKTILFLLKLKNNKSHFNRLKLATYEVTINKRNGLHHHLLRSKTRYLDSCVIRRAVNTWNLIPKGTLNLNLEYTAIKSKLKAYFAANTHYNPNSNSYGKTAWQDFRFK